MGGTGRNFCFGFLSYMWRSSVDRDRSRSCLGAGGAAVRWRALFLVWHQRHGLVVVVHQDAMLPVFVMVALVGVVERLSDVVFIRRAHHALFDVRRVDFAFVPVLFPRLVGVGARAIVVIYDRQDLVRANDSS